MKFLRVLLFALILVPNLAIAMGLGLGLGLNKAATGFDPLSTENVYFFGLSDTVELDGNTRVETWTDLSTSGNDITQSNSLLRPNYTTDDGDGKSAIVFNTFTLPGGEAAWLIPQLTGAEGQSFHFLVRRVTNGGLFISWQASRGNFNTSTAKWAWQRDEAASNVNIDDGTGIDSYAAFSLIWHDSENMDIWKNGELISSFDPENAEWETKKATVGLSGDHNARALLINESVLDAATIESLHAYLLAL